MARNPDVTPYVDLSLYDRDAQDIFEQALFDAQAKFPEWEPREGHTEVAIMESLALIAEENVFAVNRLPGAVVTAILRLYGIEPNQGTPPVADVRVTVVDTAGYTLPAGTAMRLSAGLAEPILFTFENSVTIPVGQTSVVATATGEESTSAANGLPAGTALELLDTVVYVNSVVLETAVSGGTHPETDEVFLERGVQRLRRLVTTLVLPDHFTAAALEEVDVERATTLDNFNAAAGTGAPGDHPGHVSTAVTGADGALLPVARKGEIEAVLDAQALAVLAVHVFDPTVTAVDVTVTVLRRHGVLDADVVAAVTAELEAMLSPAEWPWSGTVYRNELIARIDTVAGVERVVDLTVPAGDVELAGVANLVTTGNITVNVTAP